MTYTAPTDAFRFDEYRSAVEGKRVFITGAGRDGGIGQAFALSTGLNGAASVGVHSVSYTHLTLPTILLV